MGTPLNTSTSQFFRVSEIGFDPHNGDVYVADGHAKGKGNNNFRIVVFDKTGHYLRQWNLHRSPEEAATAARPTIHCVRVSNDEPGLRLRPLDESPASLRHQGQFHQGHAVQLQDLDSAAALGQSERVRTRRWWVRFPPSSFPSIPTRNTCT